MEIKELLNEYTLENADVSLNKNALSTERAIGYHLNRLITEMNQKEGTTIEQIAESLHISPIRLRSIITGSTSVTDSELTAIADQLEVKVTDLLQPLSDDAVYSNNIHCMGTATDAEALNNVLDKIDLYVRLLNLSSND